MKYLTFIIYTLIFISILTPVAIVIFDFFNVKFETYGNYLLWFIALALFNAILPMQTTNIFGDSRKPLEDVGKAANELRDSSVNKVIEVARKARKLQAAADAAAAAAAAAKSGKINSP